MKKFTLLLFNGLTALLIAGCAPQTIPLEQLFPPTVGSFLRVTGPFTDPTLPDVDIAIYQGPSGDIKLQIRQIGEENIDHALSELPSGSSETGYDPILGPRGGLFFTYNNEYHAAWGNGDWIFVVSGGSPEARSNFLAAYGF